MAPRMLCTDCGTTARPDTRLEGSDLAEMLGWLCLALPGWLYCAGRHALRIKVCPRCGGRELVREARARAEREALPAPGSLFGPRIENLHGPVRWPAPLLAALGGALTGAVALGAWALVDDNRALAVLSSGYGVLQQTLDGLVVGWSGVALLLLVALGKVMATSFTIGSGGSAGVFGPSMVIGGSVGGAVGIVCYEWGLVENPASLCIVGMCGFFAGAAKTPISTIVMVTEMTGSYQLLLPAVWVCGLTFLLSGRVALSGPPRPRPRRSASGPGRR